MTGDGGAIFSARKPDGHRQHDHAATRPATQRRRRHYATVGNLTVTSSTISGNSAAAATAAAFALVGNVTVTSSTI